jgi:serine O-acetyltransferase
MVGRFFGGILRLIGGRGWRGADTYVMSDSFFKRLLDDVDSVIERDPAARSRAEVILCYPGFHAVLFYRLANAAWRNKFYLLGRFLSNLGKIFTGVDIHPGAVIGRRLFIDHATGLVIGETAEIGDDVTLYHDVTLGGTSLNKGKRHPTLENGVIIGAGAQVLGPIRVGAGARVGANAVVLSDVPAGATMVGIPARMVMQREEVGEKEFRAYGTPSGDVPDPIARGFDTLRAQVSELKQRLEQLESRVPNSGADGQAIERRREM